MNRSLCIGFGLQYTGSPHMAQNVGGLGKQEIIGSGDRVREKCDRLFICDRHTLNFEVKRVEALVFALLLHLEHEPPTI
jgi:hypothetical protein